MASSPLLFPRPPASLNALRVFRLAAHRGSFKAAAESLNVTPAVITRQIKRLEDYYGLSLFLRSHRHVKLTAGGEILLQSVDIIFNRLESTVNLIKTGEDRRVISVICEHDFALLWLLPRLHLLHSVASEYLMDLRTVADDSNIEKADLVIHYNAYPVSYG